MPTLNKLEYLDETKQQIKNALNTNFNSQIQDTDTFRSYVSKINDIYTNWAKVTGEGTTLNLTPTKKGRLQSTLKGATSQDGTPTPETPIPIKVVTGEQNVKIQNLNLLPFTNQDFNLYGITVKVTDGNLYLNGTTTNEILTSNSLYKQYFSFLLKSGTYYFARGTNLSNAGIGATIKRYDDNTTLVQNNGAITITEDTMVYLGIYINKKSFSNLLIDAILTPGNQLIPYIPCGEQNYPINLNGNLLIKSTLINGQALATEDGKTFYNASTFSVSDYIKIEQNITYNISNTSNNTATRVFYYDNNYNFLSTERPVTSINSSTATYIRLQDNTTAFNDGYLIVKNGTVPVELAEVINKDYIYGTPNNWYKKSFVGKVVFDGTEEWSKLLENTNTTQFRVYVDKGKYRGLYNIMSDLFKIYSGNAEEESITGQSNAQGIQIIIDKTRANTKEDFKTWLSTHNVTAYYELDTPTDTQITDTTLITQLNNLYNATSQDGTTIITCSSTSDSNETVIINATALMKGGN